jgi:hypothetical protein
MTPGFVNPFLSLNVPLLWSALVRQFGQTVTYLLDGDLTQAFDITVIWKDGTEDEDLSPGRYSHALVQETDLPRPPKLGDGLLLNNVPYDVSRVNAYAIGYSSVVLHATQETL